MIERAAGCLKDGGRALLPKTTKLYRSRRLLHSAFWSHGARDIDLPAWWLCLLQTPTSDDRHDSRRKLGESTAKMAVGLQDFFLDFLYPLQTLAMIRRLKRSANVHQQATRNLRKAARHYTIAADIRHTQMAVNESTENESTDTLDIRSTPKESVQSDLQALLKQLNPQNYDELWQKYQDALEMSVELSAQEFISMISCLGTSKRSVDRERSLAMFESIPVAARRAIHYSKAVSVALSLEDIDSAVLIHNQALSRIQGSVGTSALFRYAVERDNFKIAFEIWRMLWKDKLIYYTMPDVWSGVQNLPLSILLDKATSAADFAASVTKKDQAEAARHFALEIIQCAFNVKGHMFDCAKHWRLIEKVLSFEDSRVLELALRQLLFMRQLLSVKSENRQYGHSALHLYRILRQRTHFHPDLEILKTVLALLCNEISVSGMHMMVEDWRRYRGKLGSRVYKDILRTLARAGQTDAVHELYGEFRRDHGHIFKNSMYHCLLYVHFARADVKSVVAAFDDLQSQPTFQSDVTCYNIIMNTFARVGDTEGALAWFNNLRESRHNPDRNSFMVLMSFFSKRGDRETVHDLLQQAQAEGLNPDIPMIDTLVLANINDQNVEEAEKVVLDSMDMQAEGSRTHMWNTLINAYALRKDLSKVSQLHRQMQDAGVPSDGLTFAALMSSLSIAKFPAPAWKILDKVMPRAGIRRTVLHYAIVMGGYLATKEYAKVFALYQDMLSRNLAPDVSTQNVLLRAAAAVDRGEQIEQVEAGMPLPDLKRARQALDQAIANLNPDEFAAKGPRKFIGPNRLDEAFTSTYFEYMIFLYGKDGAFNQVSQLYDEYVQKADQLGRRDIEASPPVRMMTALMVAHIQAGNHEEVEQCWYSTLDKSEKLACKSKAALSAPNWVLPGRRYIVSLPLQQYLRYLGDLGRIDEMIKVVNDLLHAGYDLRHGNWNIYIQRLAQSPDREHQRLAFEVCEQRLITGWPGWDVLGRPEYMKTKFKKMTKDTVILASKRLPTYLTFVYLTAVFVDNKSTRTRLEKLAPKTVDAVRNMPRINDTEQATILHRI